MQSKRIFAKAGKSTVSGEAYAKVNLFLHVLSKRTDGYHNIASLMKKINLYDRISITTNGKQGITIHTNVPELNNKNNLAFKAAEAFLNATNIGTGIDITIEKKIPMGAGLGGGSSDAAAVLNILNNITGNPLEENTLLNIASHIGSDIPFFVQHHTAALVEGKGDKITKVNCNLDNMKVLIAIPPLCIDTGYVYSKLRLTSYDNQTRISYVELLKECNLKKIESYCWNDLEKVVLKEFSGVAKLKDFLKSFFPYTIMSGSGSCVFSIVNRNEEGVIRREVEKTLGKWGVFFKTVDFI